MRACFMLAMGPALCAQTLFMDKLQSFSALPALYTSQRDKEREREGETKRERVRKREIERVR